MSADIHTSTLHKRPTEITRRQFTIASAWAILGGVSITVAACGGDSPTTPSSTTSGGSRSGIVSANHGHSATITSMQIMAGGDLTLDITGTANHPHTVQLTSGELQQIDGGQRVSKTSSNDDAHTHTVTFN